MARGQLARGSRSPTCEPRNSSMGWEMCTCRRFESSVRKKMPANSSTVTSAALGEKAKPHCTGICRMCRNNSCTPLENNSPTASPETTLIKKQ